MPVSDISRRICFPTSRLRKKMRPPSGMASTALKIRFVNTSRSSSGVLKISSCLGINRKPFQVGKEHVTVAQDYGETVIEIVSDSAGHRSECPHSLLLNHLLLRRSQFCQCLCQIGRLLLELQRSFIDQS